MSSERESGGGLDLFKVVLVVCGLACLVFGVLLFLEYRGLQEVKTAYRRGETLIPEIRAASQAIRLLHVKEKASEQVPKAHDYIEKQIMRGSNLNQNDFSFKENEKKVDKRGFQDTTFSVTFGTSKDPKHVPRQNVFNILFYLESQSTQYKVSHLRMTAVEVKRRGRGRVDPQELADDWLIEKLVVVKRGPAKVDMRKRIRNKPGG